MPEWKKYSRMNSWLSVSEEKLVVVVWFLPGNRLNSLHWAVYSVSALVRTYLDTIFYIVWALHPHVGSDLVHQKCTFFTIFKCRDKKMCVLWWHHSSLAHSHCFFVLNVMLHSGPQYHSSLIFRLAIACFTFFYNLGLVLTIDVPPVCLANCTRRKRN